MGELGAGGVNTEGGEKEMAHEGVAEVALEARDPAKPRNQAQSQLGECEARHFVGDDDVAAESQLEPTAEADAVNSGDGHERCGIDSVERGVNTLEELANAGRALFFSEQLLTPYPALVLTQT